MVVAVACEHNYKALAFDYETSNKLKPMSIGQSIHLHRKTLENMQNAVHLPKIQIVIC